MEKSLVSSDNLAENSIRKLSAQDICTAYERVQVAFVWR